MGGHTKRELEQENQDLREALEEVYDRIADVLGFEELDDENRAKR
jgi:hypothetical protein